MSNVGIKDVARKSGVSVSTVSKVLKNYPNISEKTRQKVLQVVKDTGYIPNAIASGLSSKANNRIALYIYINDKFQQIDEINMLYLMGTFDVARKLNMELITVFHDSIDHLSKEEYAIYFKSRSVDTIIILGLNKEDEKIHYLMEDDSFRFVVIDASIQNENVSCLFVDHAQGQYDVADKIVNSNDRVLYLAGKENGYVTDMRLEGIRRLAQDRNCDLTVRYGDFSEQIAYNIARSEGNDYDAIVCASDLMAIGVRKALGRKSKVKVSGFDGIRLMGYVCEDVYTCKQDFYQIGCEAVLEAENLKNGNQTRTIVVPYEITKISYKDIIS